MEIFRNHGIALQRKIFQIFIIKNNYLALIFLKDKTQLAI